MSISRSLRTWRSRGHALRFRDTLESQEFPPAEHDICSALKPEWILKHEDGLITTELGFVTMTVLPAHACFRRELTLVPGCDQSGRCGYLVFRANRIPFHSLARNARDASADALAAHQRVDTLVDRFGSKEALRAAAHAVPWYQLCTMEDTYRAGLCVWGVNSFLARARLSGISKSVGLPRVLLRFAGRYGERIAAAAAIRVENRPTHSRRRGSIPPGVTG